MSTHTHPPRIWATLDPFLESGPVLGRKVANTTFLTALLHADPYDAYHFFLPDASARTALFQELVDTFPQLVRRKAFQMLPRHTLPQCMARTAFHCMHVSDPISHFAGLMQTRNAFSTVLFPITGVTHSLSYARYIPEFLHHMWGGTSPKDCLIATSWSACRVLERIYTSLRQDMRLDSENAPEPRVERIPLGIDCSALPDAHERWDMPGGGAARELRASMGLDDACVFLCLARFSPASKMDLMPLITAVAEARAYGLSAERCAVLLAGWAEEDDPMPEALRSYAAGIGVRLEACLRPSDEQRRVLYAAADVFVSPSDNIQESFGLTVAEAGAAGLPAIVSDFDGYRDIVEHGRTGFCIPTLGFAASDELDSLASLWFDNQYLLLQAQQTAVSVPDMAEAMARLALDAALRTNMGTAARQKARSVFSWDAVITRYVEVWDRLAALQISVADEQRIRSARHPLRMRFAEFFADHFSSTLTQETASSMTLQRTPAGDALYRGHIPPTLYAGMDVMLDTAAIRKLLFCARKPVCGTEALAALRDQYATIPGLQDGQISERAAMTLLWALKHHYLQC